MSDLVGLVVTRGRRYGDTFTVDSPGRYLLGRGDDCAIRLTDPGVSRHHCELDVDEHRVRVRDLGSLNGTYLDGRGIRQDEADAGSGFHPVRGQGHLALGEACELLIMVPDRPDVFEEIAGYVPVSLLGRGGWGQVWLVRRPTDGQSYALKLMDTAVAGSLPRAAFVREASLAAQLMHPNIVRQYDSGEVDSRLYIVNELCEGGSLADYMEKCGQLMSVTTATHIILQVLDGLDYAHHATCTTSAGRTATGLVHRDIHPRNILLTDRSDSPQAKIADFGLSRLFDLPNSPYESLMDPAKTGGFAGTPDFTPRTQIINYKAVGPEVDVWAAAATYYYLLTGVPPKDLSYGEKWQLALIEPAIPIRRRNPDIPAALARVIDAALTETPTIGCRSAADLKRRIEGAL